MPVRFSNEVEWTLDCAVECGELTNDVPMFLKCFFPGDAYVENLMGLCIEDLRRRSNPKESYTQCLTRLITERCDELIINGNYDKDIFSEIIYQALFSLSMQTHAMARMIGQDLAFSITQNGKALPFLRKVRSIKGKQAQRNFVNDNAEAKAFIARGRRLCSLIQQCIKLKKLNLTVNADGTTSFNRLSAALRDYERLPQVQRSSSKKKKPPTKEKRKMLRRAMQLATGLVGEHAVHDFLNNKPIYIVGKDFTFKVELNDPFSVGHGSASISLCDTDLTPLADLCVYFEKSPALDHVAALKLHCDIGLESDIVYDANVTRLFPAAKSHALFQAIREVKNQDTLLSKKLKTVGRYIKEIERRERIAQLVENKKQSISIDDIVIDVPDTHNDTIIESVNNDPVIQTWFANGCQTTVHNATALSPSVISVGTRILRIVDSVGNSNFIWASNSSVAWNMTTATTPSTGTTPVFYVNSTVDTNNMTISWNLPNLPTPNKQNSKYMSFKNMQQNKKQRGRVAKSYLKHRTEKLFNELEIDVDSSLDLWIAEFSKKRLNDSLVDILSLKICDNKSTMAYSLADIGRERSQSLTQHEEHMYEDMLRDDNGQLPQEEPAEDHHIRRHRMLLTTGTLTRTIQNEVATIRRRNGEAADPAADESVARNVLENALATLEYEFVEHEFVED